MFTVAGLRIGMVHLELSKESLDALAVLAAPEHFDDAAFKKVIASSLQAVSASSTTFDVDLLGLYSSCDLVPLCTYLQCLTSCF